MNYVFIVSDSTGKTAELTLNAALVQFPGAAIMYKRRPGIKTKEKIKEIVKEAAKAGGIIVHTMVSDSMRDFMVRQTRLNNVENIDLMGPLLSRLSHLLSISPSEKPGLFDHLNEEYFRRVETMNFATANSVTFLILKRNVPLCTSFFFCFITPVIDISDGNK